MSTTNTRSQGHTHFNKDVILHFQSFQHVDGSVNRQDERTRFAYVVVSEEDAKKVAGSLDDDTQVIDALKQKYKASLNSAISQEYNKIARANPFLIDRLTL